MFRIVLLKMYHVSKNVRAQAVRKFKIKAILRKEDGSLNQVKRIGGQKS
jgi:hypothetical protein